MAAMNPQSADGMLLALMADEVRWSRCLPHVVHLHRVRHRHRHQARAVPSQDTITGFLLAGVGNIDLRKKRNFLVVDSSEH
jgi:hypothetical protein